MGNAVRITENEIYGNTAGISTDTISASGHPGFPADSVEIDHNNIYSNNLNLYGVENPQVPPIVGVLPVGVGIFWAGHNDGNVHDNHIFDNWRYGAQLLAVPDAAVAPARRLRARGRRRSRDLVPAAGPDLDLVQQQVPRQPHGNPARPASSPRPR